MATGVGGQQAWGINKEYEIFPLQVNGSKPAQSLENHLMTSVKRAGGLSETPARHMSCSAVDFSSLRPLKMLQEEIITDMEV